MENRLLVIILSFLKINSENFIENILLIDEFGMDIFGNNLLFFN